MDMQNRLEENETWLQETTATIENRMHKGETANVNQTDFDNWCAHTAAIEEMVLKVKNDIEKSPRDETLGSMAPDCLIEKLNSNQVSLKSV